MRFSGKLGFDCPKCHLDHGSVQLYVEKGSERRGEVRRILSLRNEVGRKPRQERVKVKPVEYAFFNRLLSDSETRWMKEALKSFEDQQFYEVLDSMPYSERQKLRDHIENACSHIEARMDYERRKGVEESQKHHKYNLVETLRTDSWVYKLMQASGCYLPLTSKEGKEDHCDVAKRKVTIEWNPINSINQYRRFGDPFRHLYFDMSFYAKVVGMYSKLMAYLNEHEEKLKKAFNVINRYRNQFPNHNWRYTWYEWFWIIRYAQKEGFGKTKQMLLSLDGDGHSLSRKGIRDQITPTMNFWKDFLTYAPIFFEFLRIVRSFIPHNQELKHENNNRLKQTEEENLNNMKKMVKEHLDRIRQHNYVPINDKRYGCKVCESLPTYYDDFKAIRKGPERLRIYHSNRNFQKEMEEYKQGSRHEKPKRKTVCYIDPRRLSLAIRVKLHKEGKVLLYK